jgi:hypothetical protein
LVSIKCSRTQRWYLCQFGFSISPRGHIFAEWR